MKSAAEKKAYRAEYHARNKDRANQLAREYYLRNKDKLDETNKNYAKANPQVVKSHKKKHRDSNKESIEASRAAWRLANPGRHRAISRNAHTQRKRLIAKQQISKFYTKQLVEIYANCPPGYHVDHRVPLRGKKVSGLHVPWNLQYLPAADNIKKSNEFDVITG